MVLSMIVAIYLDLHVSIPTYLPVLTYLHASLFTYQPTNQSINQPTSQPPPTNLPTYLYPILTYPIIITYTVMSHQIWRQCGNLHNQLVQHVHLQYFQTQPKLDRDEVHYHQDQVGKIHCCRKQIIDHHSCTL